jgi:hypothetical protein
MVSFVFGLTISASAFPDLPNGPRPKNVFSPVIVITPNDIIITAPPNIDDVLSDISPSDKSRHIDAAKQKDRKK